LFDFIILFVLLRLAVDKFPGLGFMPLDFTGEGEKVPDKCGGYNYKYLECDALKTRFIDLYKF